METVIRMMRDLQIREARKPFEAFGRIEKVFLNGAEIRPWHIDSVLIGVMQQKERLKGFSISRINQICTLRVTLIQEEKERRKVTWHRKA